MHFIFSIEGNIGSGKSTLVKRLKKHFNFLKKVKIVFLPEPVGVWESIKDKKGKNIIEKYYENQEKYAFSFQMMAYITRIHQLKESLKENANTIIICERSVFTDKEIFAKMLYDDEKIDSKKISTTIAKETYFKVTDNNKKKSWSLFGWLFKKVNYNQK